MEAFTHAIIENNYFAWLYDYKYKNPGSTLKTEYDLVEQTDTDEEEETDDDDDQIFCGDLDEVEIALPDDGIGEYKLILNECPTEVVYKEAQEATERVRKETFANINHANMNQHGHIHSYDKVNSLLMSDTSNTSSPNESHVVAKELTKKKRKSLRELKMYIGSGAKKSRRDSDNFKGWSEEGKMFMVKMMKDIKEDVESGIHGEWEKMYKKICATVKMLDEQEQESNSDAEVDFSVLYCEV